ncbi:MAG TPA: sigma-70 family RNA polymerase sigma factor [Acidimicrobiales bacterium]|nr:sigma-70 family RNA polymerase sigma factor [Acidimicrobiales bacterium]
MAQPSDEALLAGMATGDERSSVEFVRRYQRRVFGLAYSMIGDATAAQDVAQEAMLRVWRHAQVFDARRGSVTTWVLSITRNLAIDSLRMRRAIPTDPDHFGQLGLVSLAQSPEDRAVASTAIPQIRSALAALPPDQRRALVLAAVYGRTAAEISEEEGIPLGTAKTRIRAGLSKVRAAMADERVDHER